MSQVVVGLVIAGGFLIGRAVGGNRGSFAGGLGAFAAYLLVMDRIQAKRGLDGFFLRHRGTFVEFLAVVVGIILGQHFVQGFLGTMGGIAAGAFIGSWLTNTLGWAGDALDREVGVRLGYLGVLKAVAHSEGPPCQREQNELLKSARNLFADLGYSGDDELQSFLEQASQVTANLEIPNFVSQLSREWQRQLLLDAMRIVNSSRPVPSPKQQLIESLFNWSGLSDRSLLGWYNRDALVTADMRRAWLDELELPLNADLQQVESAYRSVAKKYHPDRLHDLPPEMIQLATGKLVAANAAFRGLTKQSGGAEDLAFLAESSDDTIRPNDNQPFNCRCWLCAKRNRVPSNADTGSARCGQCHALLGTPQNGF